LLSWSGIADRIELRLLVLHELMSAALLDIFKDLAVELLLGVLDLKDL
jgi:hypothetical protein